MSRKIMAVCAALTLSTHAMASCGYIDHITIKNAEIVSLSHSGLVDSKIVGPNAFDIIDRALDKDNVCNVGVSSHVTLKVKKNKAGSCNLTIEDGPYMWHPEVTSVACGGDIQYNGISNNMGFLGSGQYNLYFS